MEDPYFLLIIFMNIDYLIQLLNNRLAGLALAKDQAFQAGDLDRINAIDTEVHGVQDTLAKLHLLSGIAQTAAATPFTEAEVVKNGIEASFNFANLTDATKCLSLYDITPYATDPYHEQKIQAILEKMPFFDTAESAELYIKKAAPDSPLTGDMVMASAQMYAIDIRLMIALIELDSRFGTVGLAVKTLNPGNVGNNGVDTRNYPSWQEGTNAVAEWLSRHRIVPKAVVEVVEPVAPTDPVVPNNDPVAPNTVVEEVAPPVTPDNTTNTNSTPAAEANTPPVVENQVPETNPTVEEAPAPAEPAIVEPISAPVVSVRKTRRKLS